MTVYDVLDVHVTLKHAGWAAPSKPVCIRDDSKHRLAGPMMSPLVALVLRVGSAHTPLENGRLQYIGAIDQQWRGRRKGDNMRERRACAVRLQLSAVGDAATQTCVQIQHNTTRT